MRSGNYSVICTDMKSPFTGGKVSEFRGVESMDFRKETFNVPVRFFKCADTGQEFTTSEQDDEWSENLYGQYRRKHGIPSPDEIKSIRLKYGLTLREITLILGFGENQYSQYEKGQVPNESNGKLIALANKRANMLSLLRLSKERFTKEEYLNLRTRISEK